ncbi:hypothetical protein GOBAR_DD02141 [Gossypium barbadense]|nr:hypothetical protein GOBAR_DD02141 [Gossypium barbadense]
MPAGGGCQLAAPSARKTAAAGPDQAIRSPPSTPSNMLQRRKQHGKQAPPFAASREDYDYTRCSKEVIQHANSGGKHGPNPQVHHKCYNPTEAPLLSPKDEPYKRKQAGEKMTMPLGVALEMAKMVWIALSGWVCSCLTIADEVAASLRSGDIGPFHVG